jgi:hypothetical protein
MYITILKYNSNRKSNLGNTLEPALAKSGDKIPDRGEGRVVSSAKELRSSLTSFAQYSLGISSYLRASSLNSRLNFALRRFGTPFAIAPSGYQRSLEGDILLVRFSKRNQKIGHGNPCQ